ncbi:MAG: DsrE family protein [Roseiarcus sp.]|jgi:intracellular sulfur oxidation DsrE/DsrF family protein
MERRGFFRTLAAGGAGLIALAGLSKAEAADKDKVVYHLSDLDKVGFVLGNIRNHIAGTGGPGKVTIALVVHGPALKAFHAISAEADIENQLTDLHRDGVALNACANTMRAQKVELSDLLPGFVVAEKGGVVRLAELQGQGYAYLRP